MCEGKRSDDKMIACVRERRRREGRRREGRTESGGMAANKTRTPHSDVGKKHISSATIPMA